MPRKLLRPLAAAAVVLAAGAAWWLAGGEEAPAPAVASAAGPAASSALPAVSTAASGTSVHAPDPLLTPGLLRTFEQMLDDSQARDKEGLMAEMRAKIDKYLPPEWRVRALGLLERYIDYRNALEALPAADIGDPAGLRRILDARAGIRARYFAPEEVEGLFGAEEKFDRFSVEKLEIERNRSLTPEQKREALAKTEETWLTPEQRADRVASTAQLAVGEQTAALEARGASPQERFAERSQQYGHEAAQRLAALDQQEQDWQSRLSRYAAADEATRTQLQAELFTPQEALRLQAALEMRAAGEKRKTPSPP
ncbi:lipase chaperone [Variovorax gossypii]|uniref:Lipase helper protein n=1 Tax=Variovorax gossypii TaxID=1679495 RepID=A0A431TGS2_9BURK|nr:lipase secretion chaperone [Variovorax gossypii]RTQ32621.1 lipase chaperone [Variovorax gossypii]